MSHKCEMNVKLVDGEDQCRKPAKLSLQAGGKFFWVCKQCWTILSSPNNESVDFPETGGSDTDPSEAERSAEEAAQSAAIAKLASTAANRLHHLSMLYGGAICEIAQGKNLGGIPKGYPGLSKTRDLVDLVLLTRAEINGFTNLMVKAGLLTVDEVTKEFAEQYEWLTAQKERQFGVKCTETGLTFKVGGDGG